MLQTSQTMSKYTKNQIEAALKSKGFAWFSDDSNKGYDVNLVGIRNSSTGDKVTNLFDDLMTVSYKINGVWQYHEWAITTDPGRKAVMEYSNSKGVARLVEDQYRGAYHIGLHKGRYEALRQNKPVKVYRDGNKNLIHDEKVIEEGLFGINIHKAGKDSVIVENWSEGCQVFKREKDFEEFMEICRKSVKIHGEFLTYTLVESKDIV